MTTVTPSRPGAGGPPRRVPGSRADRAGVLLVAAVGPLVVGYAAVAAILALITSVAVGAVFSTGGVLMAAGPAWLAGYHVPARISGHDLGALPLLPTILAVTLVARASAGAAGRLGADSLNRAWPVIGAVGATHAVGGALVALVCSQESLASSPVLAFFTCGAFGTLAAIMGVVRPAAALRDVLGRADHAVMCGLRAGVLCLVAMFGAAAIVLASALVVSWPELVGLFRTSTAGLGDGLGMVLLSVAYVPNALIGTLSFLTGPGFSLGQTSVGQWSTHGGGVPRMALLAAVPSTHSAWSMLLLALPAAAAALTGWFCRRVGDRLAARVRSVLAAALLAALTSLVLAGLAGGALGGGRFDPVLVPAGLFAVSVFAWVAVVGSLAAGLPRFWRSDPVPRTVGEPPEEVGHVADQAGADEVTDSRTDVGPG